MFTGGGAWGRLSLYRRSRPALWPAPRIRPVLASSFAAGLFLCDNRSPRRLQTKRLRNCLQRKLYRYNIIYVCLHIYIHFKISMGYQKNLKFQSMFLPLICFVFKLNKHKTFAKHIIANIYLRTTYIDQNDNVLTARCAGNELLLLKNSSRCILYTYWNIWMGHDKLMKKIVIN